MTKHKNSNLSRRGFLTAAAALAAGCATSRGPSSPRIIDTHTHFYDPSRAEGVPWPDKGDSVLYRTVLPPEYIAMAEPLGIVGTVVVEASPWVEDNAWILRLAEKHPFLLALVGHLKPGTPEFSRDLQRFAAHRKFRGIRTGGWNIPIAPEKTDFLQDLGKQADLDLALDVLGGPDQLPAITRVAQALPSLRVVIDHCGGVRINGKEPDAKWVQNIWEAARQPNIYMKVSGLAENSGQTGGAPSDTSFYAPTLQVMWEAFGEDRLIFGSNWPVCARFATLETVVGIVQPYFRGQSRRAADKYFNDNAKRVYRLG